MQLPVDFRSGTAVAQSFFKMFPRRKISSQAGEHAVSPTNASHPTVLDHRWALRWYNQRAIDVFFASRSDDGLIHGLKYWQVPNGYTAVALYDLWSHSCHNTESLISQMSKAMKTYQDYVNEYNDDSMWWALCCVETYKLGKHDFCLSAARRILQHVNKYVITADQKIVVGGSDMAGAVLWTSKPGETQVNAITTGLFAELSARMAVLDHSEPHRQIWLDKAQHSLFWILQNRFLDDEQLVLDTIDLATGEKKDWSFTYNTAQALAAALAIYEAMKSHNWTSPSSEAALQYLKLACNMAEPAMTRKAWVDEDSTLVERGAYPGTGSHPKSALENDDAVGFKSILIRSLAKLYQVLRREGKEPAIQLKIAEFIKWQFQSLYHRDSNNDVQFGPWWAGPMDTPTSHSQMAALDVLAAVCAVHPVEGDP